jgi:hypothetical protein
MTTDFPDPEESVAVTLGRRYADEKSGIQVLATKAGEGTIFADEEELKEQKPRALPSSD